MQADFSRYGEDSFTFSILGSYSSKTLALARENKEIKNAQRAERKIYNTSHAVRGRKSVAVSLDSDLYEWLKKNRPARSVFLNTLIRTYKESCKK